MRYGRRELTERYFADERGTSVTRMHCSDAVSYDRRNSYVRAHRQRHVAARAGLALLHARLMPYAVNKHSHRWLNIFVNARARDINKRLFRKYRFESNILQLGIKTQRLAPHHRIRRETD